MDGIIWTKKAKLQNHFFSYHMTNQRPDEVWSFQMQCSQVSSKILISSYCHWFENWCFNGMLHQYISSHTYNLIMCGCLNNFRFWISRRILLTTSRFLIFCLLRILTATLWPVNWCSPTARKIRTKEIRVITFASKRNTKLVQCQPIHCQINK